jgi:uncharacterized protein
VRDLARRSLRWRVPLRWYLTSLVAPLLILLIAVTILYGFAPLRALAQNWLLLFTAFLPALATMILLNNVAEEIGWTGFVFARFQDRHGPLRAALVTTVFFWLFHVPSFYVETRSWATTALVLGIFLLPHLGSRLITGWLYNGAGSSVLIAGLFHSVHNAIVNFTGLVAVVALPQFEVLVIMAGIVVLAAAIITVATRGRLGLNRSSEPSAARDMSMPIDELVLGVFMPASPTRRSKGVVYLCQVVTLDLAGWSCVWCITSLLSMEDAAPFVSRLYELVRW